MAISLFIFLWFSLVSASITLQAPASVILQDSFTVKIAADAVERNDVKIYIRNDSEAILSEIQESGWKNGRYYVNDAYPQTKEFTLRAIAFSGATHLCAKLRLSDKRKTKPPTPESCIAIKIEQAPASSVPASQQPSGKNAADKETPPKKSPTKKNLSQSSQAPLTTSQQSPQPSQEEIKEEKIPLNAPSPTGRVVITAQEKTHLAIMAAFFIFVIFVLFWIVRQEKKRREQENI